MSGAFRPFKDAVKNLLPITGKDATSLTRRLRDTRALPVALSLKRKHAVVKAFEQCRSFDDYFKFTSDWMHGGAMQNLEEIRGLIEYISAENPICMCEIGTADGGTNLLLSHIPPSIEVNIGVDLYIMNTPYLRLLRKPTQHLHLINGSSYAKGTVDSVRKLLQGRQLDVLFIDGDHRYEGAKQDFLLYSDLVREDGFIIFHDIVPDRKTRLGEQSLAWTGDVPFLWQQLKQYYPCREFVRDYNQDGAGIGAIRYRRNVELPQGALTPP